MTRYSTPEEEEDEEYIEDDVIAESKTVFSELIGVELGWTFDPTDIDDGYAGDCGSFERGPCDGFERVIRLTWRNGDQYVLSTKNRQRHIVTKEDSQEIALSASDAAADAACGIVSFCETRRDALLVSLAAYESRLAINARRVELCKKLLEEQ